MALRSVRLADEVKHLLATCFQGGQLSDPRLEGVTLTSVRLSKDLQIAYVYFRNFLPTPTEDSLTALRRAKGLLRHKLAANLSVRRVPDLKFFYDESPEKTERMDRILQTIFEENRVQEIVTGV